MCSFGTLSSNDMLLMPHVWSSILGCAISPLFMYYIFIPSGKALCLGVCGQIKRRVMALIGRPDIRDSCRTCDGGNGSPSQLTFFFVHCPLLFITGEPLSSHGRPSLSFNGRLVFKQFEDPGKVKLFSCGLC